MNIKLCPSCGGLLRKEILDNGMAQLVCQDTLRKNCKWESEIMERHLLTEQQTVQEKQRDWA